MSHWIFVKQIAVPWDPSQLGAAVKAWYDADDAATITLNGSNVSQWSDKSGNGKHATQATAGLQPAYTTAGLNSRNVVTLAHDEMDVPSMFLTGTNHGAYVVATFSNTSDSFARLLSLRESGRPADYLGTVGWMPVMRNSSTNGLRSYQNGATTPDYAAPYNTPMLLASTLESDVKFWVNGVAVGTKAGTPYLYTTDGLRIGRSLSSSDEHWNGVVGEIIFTNNLSTTDRQKLEGYLAWKWGLESSLPAGHPYESAAPIV